VVCVAVVLLNGAEQENMYIAEPIVGCSVAYNNGGSPQGWAGVVSLLVFRVVLPHGPGAARVVSC
jgi:hypothetical protein